MTKPFCVQHHLICDTESNMNNAFNGIQTAISAITTAWENQANPNSNSKGFKDVSNKWEVSGIHRMSSETEKNTLINVIRGMSSPPFISGKVTSHTCSHMSWKCRACNHVWDTMELSPEICPSCGSPAEIIVDDKVKIIIISDVKPCIISESWEL